MPTEKKIKQEEKLRTIKASCAPDKSTNRRKHAVKRSTDGRALGERESKRLNQIYSSNISIDEVAFFLRCVTHTPT